MYILTIRIHASVTYSKITIFLLTFGIFKQIHVCSFLSLISCFKPIILSIFSENATKSLVFRRFQGVGDGTLA